MSAAMAVRVFRTHCSSRRCTCRSPIAHCAGRLDSDVKNMPTSLSSRAIASSSAMVLPPLLAMRSWMSSALALVNAVSAAPRGETLAGLPQMLQVFRAALIQVEFAVTPAVDHALHRPACERRLARNRGAAPFLRPRPAPEHPRLPTCRAKPWTKSLSQYLSLAIGAERTFALQRLQLCLAQQQQHHRLLSGHGSGFWLLTCHSYFPSIDTRRQSAADRSRTQAGEPEPEPRISMVQIFLDRHRRAVPPF